MLDEKAIIFNVRYLYGKYGRRCGGHKREGGVHYPGRSVDLPLVLMTSRGVVMDRQKSAEGIVGVSTALKART